MAEHDELADAEIAELRRLAERVRPGDVTWEEPPAELWSRIAAEIEAPAPIAAAPRRRRTLWSAVAAAAAVILVAVAAVVLRDGGDQPNVVAAVTLDRLGPTGSGRAELVERGGAHQLVVETDDLDAGDGYLELWMIDPTVTKLVSLGPVRPDGTYEVPAGVDPAAFPIIDVSAEPVDGDPAHSGQSLLRGQLPL